MQYASIVLVRAQFTFTCLQNQLEGKYKKCCAQTQKLNVLQAF